MATVVKPRRQEEILALPARRKTKGLGRGVYTLWLKHMRKFFSSSMEIGGTLATPVLWMLLFAVCMETIVTGTDGLGYKSFITPGVMLLTSLTSIALGGATMLNERLQGIMKEYLVAPVPRIAVLLGTMASSLTKALLQGIVVLWLGVFMDSGLHFRPAMLIAGLGVVVIYCLGFIGVTAAYACRATNMEGYHTFIMLINLPILFLSNALYPLSAMPNGLRILAMLNPTTYAIDATRQLFYDTTPEIGLWIDIPVLLLFMVAGLWYGQRTFQRSVTKLVG